MGSFSSDFSRSTARTLPRKQCIIQPCGLLRKCRPHQAMDNNEEEKTEAVVGQCSPYTTEPFHIRD